jgi:hypothetical protein
MVHLRMEDRERVSRVGRTSRAEDFEFPFDIRNQAVRQRGSVCLYESSHALRTSGSCETTVGTKHINDMITNKYSGIHGAARLDRSVIRCVSRA